MFHRYIALENNDKGTERFSAPHRKSVTSQELQRSQSILQVHGPNKRTDESREALYKSQTFSNFICLGRSHNTFLLSFPLTRQITRTGHPQVKTQWHSDRQQPHTDILEQLFPLPGSSQNSPTGEQAPSWHSPRTSCFIHTLPPKSSSLGFGSPSKVSRLSVSSSKTCVCYESISSLCN